jgi:hypothetical protein
MFGMSERRVTVVLRGQLLRAFEDFRFETRAESLAEAGEALFVQALAAQGRTVKDEPPEPPPKPKSGVRQKFADPR